MQSRARPLAHQRERHGQVAPVDWQAVVAGVLAAFALTVLVSAILALAIYFANLTESTVSGLLYGVGLVTVAAGGAVAGRRAGTRGWLHGGLVGLAYVLLSLLIGSLLFSGPALWADLVGKLFTAFVAGSLGGIVGVNS